MKNRSHIGLSLLLALSLGAAGCTWFGSPDSGTTAVSTVEEKPFQVSATPSFRLIFDQSTGELPSRLVVVWARIETDKPHTFDFRPIDARLTLPDGGKVRVLDRARAAVLIRRTWLGAFDLSYRDQRGHAWGGIAEPVRKKLQQEVISELLDDSALSKHRPLEGYLVVDTATPLATLERVGLEIVARRIPDRARVRNTYQFAASTVRQP